MEATAIPLLNLLKTQKYSSHPRHRHRHRHRHIHSIVFVFYLLAAIATCEIEYSKYCNHIVPESPIDPANRAAVSASQSLLLTSAFFSGGDPLFHFDPINWPKSVKFLPSFARRTANDSVVSVEARLSLAIPRPYSGSGIVRHRKLRQQVFRVRGPKFPVRRGVAFFRLRGYWSESDGRLCMVGSGSKYQNEGKVETFNVVLKLHYSNSLNLSVVDSLVSGVLESVDVEASKSYFKPVSILGVAQFDERTYNFTLLDKENDNGNWFIGGTDQEKSLSINNVDGGVCSLLGLRNFRFQLEYSGDCDRGNVSCNPVARNVGDVPGSMFFKGIRCAEKKKMQMLLGFWNSSFTSVRFPFDPHTTLIAEGAWDEKRNQLLGVACQILNFTESLTDAYVGDCSVRLSLRFPAVFSIRNRDTIVGKIWSSKSENDPKYFGKIGFGSSEEVLAGLPGFQYDYSMLDVARKTCANKNGVRHKGKTYPDAYSVDMRFDMSVKNIRGRTASGFASPLFVGDRFYEHQLYGRQLVPALLRSNASVVQLSNSPSSLLNISYKMSFTPEFGFKFGDGDGDEMFSSGTVKISAEGIYDMDTGVLCMIGCRQLGSGHEKENSTKNDSLDCEIAINVQFRALNVEGSENVKGIIESKRDKLDPLYFGRLDLSSHSIYTRQAVDSVWRMDLEITMVLISNTLACVFVGLQLYYVRKHPDVLPFISVVMLIILTLRYMIPLLLNFEALFKTNGNQQNIFLGSGGWLETNEIIVRVVTMVAFLLQFRLLQLTWSARQGDDGGQNDLWLSEKKVLYVCLPLYIAGGLIAWAVYLFKNSYQTHILKPHGAFSYHQRFLWGDLKSYVGLVLDGFLLPQIMFNAFFNSTEKALASSFYIGTTIVRILPHAYDLYRAHSSDWYMDMSYIYANPKMDLYSTAWDIIIPCGGLLFAALIFWQQRLGGRCIFFFRRIRNSSGYEKVSVESSVELQEGTTDNKNSYN